MSTFYSPREVAKKTGLSYMQVMRRIRSGQIEAKKIDWNWIIPEAEIKKLNGQKNETA